MPGLLRTTAGSAWDSAFRWSFVLQTTFLSIGFWRCCFGFAGMNAADAAALGNRSRERPAEFLLVAPRYRMNPREVQVASGAAVLLRYSSDDRLERRTLVWNARDRAYFLSGYLTEVEAMAIANSLK